MGDELTARTSILARLRVDEFRRLTPALAAGVLIGAALLARLLIVREVAAPWIMPDELEYSEMAKSFAAGGHFLYRTQPSSLFSFYPVLIAPAWRAGSMNTTYELAKMINVVLMTSAAVPFYLWARRLAGGWHAVVGTVLFLTLPTFAFTGTLMSENAAFPLFMLSFFAIALTLERPTVLRQLAAVAVIGLACLMRLQALVLVPLFPAAIVCKVFVDATSGAIARRLRVLVAEVRRYLLAPALLAAAVLAYVLAKVAGGQSLSSGLRAYSSTATAHYSIRDVARWSVYHAAELTLALGVLPVCALVVLFGLLRAASRPTATERAYLAVTIPALLLIIVQVAAFASRFSLRVEERNMCYVEPLLVLALVVWLARGLPRPPALVVASVLVPVALLITLPLESLFNESIITTFGLVPFYRLSATLNGGVGGVRTLIGLGALGAGLLFAIAPRRVASWGIPITVGVFLGFSARSVFANEAFIANATRYSGGLSGDASWIDDSVGNDRRVEFLYTTDIDRNQHIAWQAEFWNRSVRRVFGVTSQDPSIPDVSAPLDPATGRIIPNLPPDSPDLRPRFVVAASNVDVAGKRLAQAGFLTLYRVRQPLGLASAVEGVYEDGWTGGSAAYTRYVPPAAGSRLHVTVSRAGIVGPPRAQVQVVVGALRASKGSPSLGRVWVKRRWTLAAGAEHVFVVPLRPKAFRVQMASPTFAPSEYGSADTRQLGVNVSFALR